MVLGLQHLHSDSPHLLQRVAVFSGALQRLHLDNLRLPLVGDSSEALLLLPLDQQQAAGSAAPPQRLRPVFSDNPHPQRVDSDNQLHLLPDFSDRQPQPHRPVYLDNNLRPLQDYSVQQLQPPPLQEDYSVQLQLLLPGDSSGEAPLLHPQPASLDSNPRRADSAKLPHQPLGFLVRRLQLRQQVSLDSQRHHLLRGYLVLLQRLQQAFLVSSKRNPEGCSPNPQALPRVVPSLVRRQPPLPIMPCHRFRHHRQMQFLHSNSQP